MKAKGLLWFLVVFVSLGVLSVNGYAADWWSMPNEQCFAEYGKLAVGSQEERSRFAWMLFARVNQPAGQQGENEFLAWELWASNDETFTANPVWPEGRFRDTPAFTKAKAQVPKTGGEEVVRNRESFDYITQRQPPLYTVQGLQEVFASQSFINFPIGAIEIKANWTTATGTTYWGEPAPIQPDMYQLKSSGINHGLNGMHIMAKVAPTPSDPVQSPDPSWFWTTFEYRNNPGRDAALKFITHPDALPPGEARALLAQAGLQGNIAESYQCNGTQIHFVDPGSGEPILLGNTTMEAFAGHPAKTPPAAWNMWTTSCHTCHGQTRMNQGPPNVSPPRFQFVPQSGPIGPIDPSVVEGTWPIDFVWSVPDRAYPPPRR